MALHDLVDLGRVCRGILGLRVEGSVALNYRSTFPGPSRSVNTPLVELVALSGGDVKKELGGELRVGFKSFS